VWNPGQGGGGSGAVFTDGVTIQGDGTSGSKIALLDAMTDGTTLQGAGIAADKLSIKPVPFFFTNATGNSFPPTTNRVIVFGVTMYAPILVSNIFVGVDGDNSGALYDLGFYDFGGNLITHVGAQSFPTGAGYNLPLLGGPILFPQGLYMFAFTGNNNVAAPQGNNQEFCWAWNQDQGPSVGGVLPPTISPLAVGPSTPQVGFALY
jgi:hypothetical protein